MSLLQIKIAPEKFLENSGFDSSENINKSTKASKSISSLLFILRDLSGLKLSQI